MPEGLQLPIPAAPEDLTAAWFSTLFTLHGQPEGSVAMAVPEPLGVGQGFVGNTFRVRLSYWPFAEGGPASVVVKLPAGNPRARAALAALRYYEREVRFYRDIAPVAPLNTPLCYHGAFDPATGDAVLVLEDVADVTPGDDLEGCPPDRAEPVVDRLAALHAGYWGRYGQPGLEWLPRFDQDQPDVFFERVWRKMAIRHRHTLPADFPPIAEELCAKLPAFRARMAQAPLTVAHGDVRTDNLLFTSTGVTFVDWQLVEWARGPLDLGYFLTQSFHPDDRRKRETALVDRYHAALTAHGVRGYTRNDCWQDYRLGVLQNACTFIFAGGSLDFATDRAKRLLAVTLERITAAVADLHPFELL